MSVRYRSTLDMGTRTTQSPPLLIWKTLFSSDRAMTIDEISDATGLSTAIIKAVLADPYYKTYGIMTEEEWEAANPPRPEPEPEAEDDMDGDEDVEGDEAVE